jgi:hypothetical protein
MRIGDANSCDERRAVLIDAATGEEVLPENTILLPGPAADDDVRERIERMRLRRLRLNAEQ